VPGANFAIAETGSLVVAESEGNGRMCVTLPETLISVAGIEQILPSWRDLEVSLAAGIIVLRVRDQRHR
jgi:L-lactate dehydrogenase complex protein LldF